MTRKRATEGWWKDFLMEPAFRRKIEFLGSVPLFAGIPRRGLKALLQALTARDYHKDEVLCEAGAVGHFLFLIESGTVDVIRPGRESAKRRVATLGPGTFFGELAVLSDQPRISTVVAMEPVRAYLLYKTELQRLVADEPSIGATIMQRLAELLAARLLAEVGVKSEA